MEAKKEIKNLYRKRITVRDSRFLLCHIAIPNEGIKFFFIDTKTGNRWSDEPVPVDSMKSLRVYARKIGKVEVEAL